MKSNKIKIAIVLFLATLQGSSQEVLTKKQALEIALENNFGIKIANNNLKVAKNNAGIYNSGYLPTTALNSGADYRNNNQKIIFTDPQTDNDAERVGTGAVTKSYNVSLGLNYTLFDGLGRKYNYQQLKETYNLTALQAKETIENTYLQLFTVYFQIARLSENTLNLEEALTISQRRFKRAKYQYEYGQTTKLEVLNAEVDINNDSILIINARQQLSNAKRGLNTVLGIEKNENYQVETGVNFNRLMNFEALQQKTIANNTVLKQNQKNIAISKFNIKINKANYLPSLNFSTSYGFNRTENENLVNPFGARLITSDGLNAGLNLSWNIFDGGATKTRVANAKIALENQQILLDQQKFAIQNSLKNTWENYRNQLFILKSQEKNIQTTQNNFDRTQEKYRLGQVTSIEFRQAQINLINSKRPLIMLSLMLN